MDLEKLLQLKEKAASWGAYYDNTPTEDGLSQILISVIDELLVTRKEILKLQAKLAHPNR
jgi:hypothetical protein